MPPVRQNLSPKKVKFLFLFSILIKVLDDKNENCLWFELNFSSVIKKIFIGAVYLPPEGSTEFFDKLEYDVLNFTSESDSYLRLLGDFNARSSILSTCNHSQQIAYRRSSCLLQVLQRKKHRYE